MPGMSTSPPHNTSPRANDGGVSSPGRTAGRGDKALPPDEPNTIVRILCLAASMPECDRGMRSPAGPVHQQIIRWNVVVLWSSAYQPMIEREALPPAGYWGVTHTGTSYLASQHIHRLGSVDNDAVCALDYRYAPRQVLAILKTCVCVCVQLR